METIHSSAMSHTADCFHDKAIVDITVCGQKNWDFAPHVDKI